MTCETIRNSNLCPQIKFRWSAVLLLPLCIFSGCFHAGQEDWACDRDRIACKSLKMYYATLRGESFLTPDVDPLIMQPKIAFLKKKVSVSHCWFILSFQVTNNPLCSLYELLKIRGFSLCAAFIFTMLSVWFYVSSYSVSSDWCSNIILTWKYLLESCLIGQTGWPA